MPTPAHPAPEIAAQRAAPARSVLLGLAAGVAASLASPAGSAQIAPGASGSSSTIVVEDDGEAWRTLVAFGNCYAQRNTASALALMATEPGSRDEAQIYRRLFSRDNQSCLGGNTELSMPLAMVRGAIVEGLYRRRVAVPEALVQPPLAPEVPVRTLSEAARCYASVHRARVEALVAESRAGSREESERLQTMAADFFRCVPETARGRRFDPTLIRYRLVEALVRLPAAAAALPAAAEMAR